MRHLLKLYDFVRGGAHRLYFAHRLSKTALCQKSKENTRCIQRTFTRPPTPYILSQLVESIRPYLPLIAHLPYGKKMQYKIMKEDAALGGADAGQLVKRSSG